MSTITYNAKSGLYLTGYEIGCWCGETNSYTDLTLGSKDLTLNGTLTQSVTATGSASIQYSGFSTSNYLEHAYDSDFDLTGGSPETVGHTLMAWVNVGTVSGIETVIDRHNSGSPYGTRYNLRIQSDGTVRSVIYDGVTTSNCDGTTDLNNAGWVLLTATWDGTNHRVYVNGVLENELTPTIGSLVNYSAIFRIGLSALDTDPCDQGISLPRVMYAPLSNASILSIYDSEKQMFNENGIYLQYGEAADVSVPVAVLNRSGTAQRKVSYSIGGSKQTIFNREDVKWDINTSELTGGEVTAVQYMLQAGLQGEILTFDPYDTNQLILTTLDSNSYTASRIEYGDYFTFKFILREEI